MPLNAKARMNLVLAGIGAVAIAASSAMLWSYLDAKSLEDIQRQAEMQMKTAEAIRSYTVDQLLAMAQNEHDGDEPFHRESVPAHAATTTLGYLYRSMDGYSYREVAMNPTNTKNQALGWSVEIINDFREQNAFPSCSA